ncbi:MAG: tetratricopeptide repeat protein [Pseudomonadota bacterium]
MSRAERVLAGAPPAAGIRTGPAGRLVICCALLLNASLASAADSTAVTTSLRAAEGAYESGRFDTAYRLAGPLADRGVAPARYLLARLHLRPRSGVFDPREAARLMLAAAETGYVRAQHGIAELYRRGVGVRKDPLNAFRWHLRAAEQRHRASEAAIGVMYANGEGVAPDPAQAQIWRERAARPRPPTSPGHTVTAASRWGLADSASGVAKPAAPPASAPARRETTQRRFSRSGEGPVRFIVQLGAYRSRAVAERHRLRVERAVRGFLKGFTVTVTSRDKGDGNGLLHRLEAGPLEGLAAASFTCRTIRKRVPQQGCFATQESR